VNTLRQIFVVCAAGLSGLPQRRSTALVIVVGSACVVGVLLSMLCVTVGLTRAFQAGGSPSRAIVYAKQTGGGEWGTGITRESFGTILNAPGIARSADGRPKADAELIMSLIPPEGFVDGTLGLRAFGPAGAAVHPQFTIVAGRMFHTGAQEVVVGARVARKFRFAVGGKVGMPQGEWPIVGVFTSGGDRLEGEFVADADTVMSAAKVNGFGSVIAQLVDPSAFPEFEAWLVSNPTLTVGVERQTDFNTRQAGNAVERFIRISYGIGIIMGLGAMFGASRIMFAAVRARTREIGTLRAIGFGGVAVAASILAESMALSLAGAAIGSAASWLLFDGREFPMWWSFRLQVSPQLVAIGLLWGAAIALLGGALPALRAARLTPVEALRAA
jgi:putative ABC transport system permease protein